MTPTTPAQPRHPLTTEGSDRFGALLARLRASPVEEWGAHLRDVTILDVAPHLAFDPGRYTRTLLSADDHAELLVMGWLPAQASAIHDHGRSHGAALVLAGEAEEESFHVRQGRADRIATAPLRRGQVTIERPTDVHRIRNYGTQLLVTLHAYAPRLTEYTTYEP